MKDICHLTLNSGHVCPIKETDLMDGLYFAINRIFKDSIGKGCLMEFDGEKFWIKTTLSQEGGLTTLYFFGSDKDQLLIPIVTVGYSDKNYTVYNLLLEIAKMKKGKAVVPTIPYVVDAIDIGLMLKPKCATWTGDFSKCIGLIALGGTDLIKQK